MSQITKLDPAGILKSSTRATRTHYEIVAREPLRHPIEASCNLEMLLRTVVEAEEKDTAGSP